MKRIIIGLLAVVSFLLFLAGPAGATAIDITNGGMEVTGPNAMTIHNVLANGKYYYVNFQWNSRRNTWSATGYGLEEPTFDAGEYFPLKQGSTWTYQTSAGEPLTLTVNGTETICGHSSIRVDGSDGTRTYWLSDNTGISMSRYEFADGSYNEWCVPIKMSPAQAYLGGQSLEPTTGVIGGPYGPFGTLSGWTQFAVKSVEDVTVPAGTFTNCMQATFMFTYDESSSGGHGIRVEEFWFAKNIGMVKRINVETFCIGGSIYANSAETYLLQSYSIPQ